jgi:hypothetical protein
MKNPKLKFNDAIVNNIYSKVNNDAGLNKLIKYEKNAEDVINKFKIDNLIEDTYENKCKFPIITRMGGIGDLIALSSVAVNLVNKIEIPSTNLKFISQDKYKCVFEWYKNPITFVPYFSPIVKNEGLGFLDKKRINSRYKLIYYEGIIENSKINWYELQFNILGSNNFTSEFGRPQLRTDRITDKKSNIDLTKKSILINPRSTAIIRSMRFQDIYESIVRCIGNVDINIYVHKVNLRKYDIEYISAINDSRIKIISANSLSDFFLDMYDVTLSISVDTALLHFREGIEKPAVGLYGPFTSESRSKYYKYTKCLDIKSDCPDMPCFIHVRSADAICSYQEKLHKDGLYSKQFYEYAPCCCAAYNKTVQNQIIDNFKEYIIESLK